MTHTRWHFNKVRPSQKNREDTLGAFFAANKDIVSSLVRESVQNSLDARLPGSADPVRIRFFISDNESALSWADAGRFFDGAQQHYTAENSGIKDCPAEDVPCRFLVVEDFNTSGLNGNIIEYAPPDPTVKNSFYSFFRSEGHSDKSHTDRGRWGAGKTVFHEASQIKTFFALTVRSEDKKEYLVGQTVLRTHKVGDVAYTPDGWYGGFEQITPPGGEADYLHMPVDTQHEPTTVDSFRRMFRIARRAESGLSVVVPYIDTEVTYEHLVRAVIEDYFWPILTNDLYVSIECGREQCQIESGSLLKVCEAFRVSQDSEVMAMIELAQWATGAEEKRESVATILPKATAPPKWTEDLIEAQQQVQLRKRLSAGDRIDVRVPITIRERHGEGKETHFHVFLQRHPEAKNGVPTFIRKGIIIPRVPCMKTPGTVALVIADDPVVADFLGNAENPAHTEWQDNSANFKNRYYYGSDTLRFIKNSAVGILRILDESSKQEDRTLLLDIFSIPIPSEGVRSLDRKRRSKKPGETPDTPTEIPPPKPKLYRVTKIQGGFTISQGERACLLPAVLDVRLWYARRTGRKRYDINDFRLEKLSIDPKGMKLIQTKGNRLIAQILNQDFTLRVKGFDSKRDLLVKPLVTEQEAEDAEA